MTCRAVVSIQERLAKAFISREGKSFLNRDDTLENDVLIRNIIDEEVLIPGCGVTDTNQLKDPALSSVTDDLNVTLHISC
jgi:hypothetical protein